MDCSGLLFGVGPALGQGRRQGVSTTGAPLCPADGEVRVLNTLDTVSLTLASNCQQNFKISRSAVLGTQCDYNVTGTSRCAATPFAQLAARPYQSPTWTS